MLRAERLRRTSTRVQSWLAATIGARGWPILGGRCGGGGKNRRQLGVEALEERSLLSVAPTWTSADSTGWFVGSASEATATLQFSFEGLPEFEDSANGSVVRLAGEESWIVAGDPVVPVRQSTLLLPPGMEISSVEVSYGDPGTVLGTAETLLSSPAALPLDGGDGLTAGVLDPHAGSLTEHSAGAFSNYILGGMRLGSLRVFPVEYDVVTELVVFHGQIDVTIHARAADDGASLAVTATTADLERVAGLVDNPQLLVAYGSAASDSHASAIETREEPAVPAGMYDYVIITSTGLEGSFQPLVAEKLSRGLTARTVTTEYIYANYTGTETGDKPDKIRHFISDAYSRWGTRWVLLGGDIEVVPQRGVYANSGSYTQNALPTDMYYACLNGTWNRDGDALWGEATDGATGKDIDLLPEVFIGRAPVSSVAEATNFVNKTVLYETSPHPNYDTAIWLGENLDAQTWGSTSAIAIRDRTLPTTWNVVERYDVPGSSYSGGTVTADLNASPHIVEHLGHSNQTYNARIDNSTVAGLTNAFPYLMYSQGCDSGSFDTHDLSIAEQHVVEDDGALAVVMNSRYGWYAPGGTPAYSHYYAMEFWDALFNEGKLHLGEANQDSKDDNLFRVGATGTYRWIHLETNLFGDPETPFQRNGVPVNATNYAPVANDDYYTVTAGFSLAPGAGGVLANDVDRNRDPLTAVLVTGPTQGTLTLNPDGSFIYTPSLGFVGTDRFTYKAKDPTQESALATVTIVVQDPAQGRSFDFGTANSPVESGYMQVANTTLYTSALGYGWQTAMKAYDLGTANALNRDYNYGTSGRFLVDLANGSYDVTVTLGDTKWAHEQMGVTLEGVQVDTLSHAVGEYVTRTYQVEVVDGQLTLDLKDTGGSDPHFLINALAIKPHVVSMAKSFDFGTASSPVESGYTQVVDTTLYTSALGYGWQTAMKAYDLGTANALNRDYNYGTSGRFLVDLANGSYDVTVTLGDTKWAHEQMGVTLEGAQVDTLSHAVGEYVTRTYQVEVVDGQLTLDLKDTGGSDPHFLINALAIKPHVVSMAKSFDFGTASSPVESGYTQVVDTTLYTSALGYGWQTAMKAYDLGTANALNRDYNYGTSGRFLVDLANGSYDVTVTLGDTKWAHEQMGVTLEGVQVDTLSHAVGEYVTRTYQVEVVDGQLTLDLKDTGGSDPHFLINALAIKPHVVSMAKSFDFGTASSPVESGYTQVVDTTLYTSALGYGWQTAMKAYDLGTANALNRDYNYGTSGRFLVDLANGSYDVTVTLGDTKWAHEQMGVTLEGAQVDTLSHAVGEYVTRTYQVEVVDGQLTLDLKDTGGSDPHFLINALAIKSRPTGMTSAAVDRVFDANGLETVSPSPGQDEIELGLHSTASLNRDLERYVDSVLMEKW